MTSSLTDRYVAATLRRIPEKQRPEIERELRAAIADDTDARLDQGATPAEAERAALVELGDPYRLAAGYTNRSLALIGPDVYPTYIRTLTVLGSIVLPIVAALLVVVSAAQGKGVWASIFGPLGTVIQVAIYMAVVVTILFVVLERVSLPRTPDGKSPLAWTPEQLPVDLEGPRLKGWGEVVGQVVGTLIAVAFLFFDRYSPFVNGSDGHPVPVLDPRLWAFWIPLFLVLLALGIVLEFVKLNLRRWTVVTAIVDTLLGLASTAAVVAVVLTTTVVNPALTTIAVLQPASWIWWVVAAIVAATWVGHVVDTWNPNKRRTAQPV